MHFNELNYFAIATAAAVKFCIGGLWYSPKLFANPWLAELKITPEQVAAAKGHGKPNLLIAFLLGLVQVFALAVVLKGFRSDCLGCAAGTGLMLSVAFGAVPTATNYLFEQRSVRFLLINAGYDAVTLVLAGVILGAWPK
ncbi:MAG: DUF1761 domain-containing protein [Verrucomicrobia bacterium]|nr:DUF1761 domain-containing protein [Verrucomicrobiota bacterium]